MNALAQTIDRRLAGAFALQKTAVAPDSGMPRVASLASKCEFPVFQDVSDVNAWALHEGGKDDFYIFDANGELTAYLPYGGDVNVSLGSQAGFANVKNAIIDSF